MSTNKYTSHHTKILSFFNIILKLYFDFLLKIWYNLCKFGNVLFPGGECLYNIGEKIVYPMHGAGTIEAIEEKEILGKLQKYYILKIATTHMDIMVPVATADEIGVRPIIDQKDLSSIFEDIKHYDETDELNWNKRYRLNLQKLKTGSITEVGHVIKSLLMRESVKTLSTCEKRMLNNARQIMASEIVLATNRDLEDVEQQIDALVC